ncbi:TPA: hypothetical protein ACGO2R_000128 [Streptococcus suis]|uniref:hypothetical protein n=1 Tax=Streptococcus suis TaxID=1307 RepID=UPI001478BF64
MKVETKDTVKKPFYKKNWFIALIVLFIIGLFMPKNEEQKNAEVSTQTTTSRSSTTDAVESSNTAENTTESASVESFILTAGDIGQYGKKIVMNEGTDMPEELVVFYLPSGDYQVKNVGNFPSQLNVYEGFKRDETTGYDDYTNGQSILLKVDETGTINIPEGWFVEIHEPSQFELVKQ